ncbi:hypothetical protein GGR55DRAFT_689508 [Xylaria sp. FL0064]|nr:hypothetical protein GGR55DRAFT_689508 [Xylaria sp. FL0064]
MFASRGMAPPKMPPPSEVRREANARSANIFAYYERLQGILERHEATIRKRWEKKTRTQRLSILLQAWPGMPLTHRPDFAAFRNHAGNLNSAAIKHRSSFIWPIINQEDLGDPSTLPLLLNSRGRNHPHVFAASDGEGMHLGKVTMAIVPICLNEYVMTLNAMTRREDYGRLIAWGEYEDAYHWMRTRKQFLPGEGLLILEFQERLLEFLADCCKGILHDIPLDQMTSDKFAIQPEPPLKESLDATGFSTLSILAKEAPYRPPPGLDLQKIESLLSARTIRAEDHIWSLREDPDYFAETMLEMKEHLLDVYANRKPPRDDLRWARVINSVLKLRNQAAYLRDLLSITCIPELSPQNDFPGEYLEALLKFQHYLKQSVAASPPLKPFFVRNIPTMAKTPVVNIISNDAIRKDKIAQHLIWLLQILWEDDHNLFLCRMTIVIDELDRLLKAEPKALGLVSPYIAMLIGEFSITGECLRQLEIFQPWANTAWAKVRDTLEERELVAIWELGDPSNGQFQYPVGKRQNKANVEALRRSEANLDAFWNSVDDMLYQAGSLNGTTYKYVLSQPRYLRRTPEWLEPAAKKEEKSNKNRKQSKESYEYVPFSSRLFREVKHRGMPSAESTSEDDTALPPPSSLPDVQPTFRVDARALRVFRVVFFDPAANTSAGEVAWHDFLHAMDSTGFTAQKLYGSVWHFQPSRLDVERSIQFHESHPRSKIPFPVARRHGRRLNRVYGWHGAMFILKDNN